MNLLNRISDYVFGTVPKNTTSIDLFRACAKAGDLVEYKSDGAWFRKRVQRIDGDTFLMRDGDKTVRNSIFPAHGEDEIIVGKLSVVA